MLSAEQEASSFCKQFSLRPPGKAKVENKSLNTIEFCWLPYPLVLKQCCILCALYTLSCPEKCSLFTTLFGGGGRGWPLEASKLLQKWISCYSCIFDICFYCWRKGFNNCSRDFLPPLQFYRANVHGIQTKTYKLRFPGEIVSKEFWSYFFAFLFEFFWMTRALRFVFLCLAGVMIFHDFLKSQYSEENLLFWLAVEKLKKETDQAAVKELAQSIYRDYLSAESPKEVSNNVYIIFVRELLSNSERIFSGVRENGLASDHINSSPPKKGKSE